MALGEQDRQAVEQLARRFAQDALAAVEREDDRYPFAPWNRAAWRTAAELGLPGLALPESVGGSEQGLLTLARALEIVARAEAGHATVLLTQALARATVVALGPQSSAARWATLRSDAQESLLAYPLYEDPEELGDGVRARRDGAGFVLDGQLQQLSCLPIAQAVLVPALLADSGEQAFFILPTNTAGVSVSEPIVTLGLRACPLADLRLANVRVEAAGRLGGADAAAAYARTAESYRPALVAVALGVLSASYDLAFAYACERKQSKRNIVLHHMVQEMLAGMASTLDLGALTLERACQLAEQGGGSGTELLSFQEVLCTLITRVSTDGVQVLGGNGYMHDYGQEKHMRDAKQLQTVLGSPTTRRLRILERRLARAQA